MSTTDELGAAMSRRNFFSFLCYVMGSVAATTIAIPLTAFVVSPLWEKSPEKWRDVGGADEFAIGTTSQVKFEDATSLPWAGVSALTAAWLRRDGPDEFIAFSVNCTHLGCPVRWLPEADLFMCPCHGGVYYGNGTVAAGPPPLPLPRYDVRLRTNKNGERRVEIKASPIPITTV